MSCLIICHPLWGVLRQAEGHTKEEEEESAVLRKGAPSSTRIYMRGRDVTGPGIEPEIFCYQGRRSYQLSYLGTIPVPATLLSTNFSGFHALETSHKTPHHLESISLAPFL
ncbi:hypothetical protein FSP39_017649 [Pinctada imbricata]|uniref:Uncharacterized protein n=1 Tax=Pinctada imbricata TaxID=66713 RepID=A0AA88YXH8_PINIB|nr:hypothetical protein FSP39_017649 [Pinctada imbricata]